jgi:2-alkenal reductase
MKKIIEVFESLCVISLIIIVFVYGISINQDITIVDYTPEKTNFPLDSIVYVEANAGWSGSAIVLDNDTLLTAGHVAYGSLGLNIFPDDKSDYYAESDSMFIYPFDAAIIHTESKLLSPPIRIGKSSDIKVGDTIYIIGYPFSVKSDVVTKGIISCTSRRCDRIFGDIDLITVDAAAWSGNSGGAVINDAGELIGILVGVRYGFDSFSIVIPIDALNLEETLNETKL